MAEDILGGCRMAGITAPGRAGWPTAHAEQRAAEVAMSSPFGLAAQGGRNRLPAGRPKSLTESCSRISRAVHELGI